MANAHKTCDVFISHSVRDAALASEIAIACRENALAAISYNELLSTKSVSDALWEALAESRALLVILPQSGLTPSMAIELGAAQAWNKPIYGVITDPTFTRPASGMSGIQLYTTGRVEEVIRAIKLAKNEISNDDRTLLSALYANMGTSIDEFAIDARRLEILVARFNSGTGKALRGEQLLSELLRMRKQGKLPRRKKKASGVKSKSTVN